MAMDRLYRKLNIDKFNKICIVDKPDDIYYFNDIDFDKIILKENYDLIIYFVYDLNTMENQIINTEKRELIPFKKSIYFIYPKKSSKNYDKYIKRDDIFLYLNVDENTGFIKDSEFKFYKMVSFDEDFTLVGLRREKIEEFNENKYIDYSDFIEDIENVLSKYSKALKYFEKLSFGYKREWARYVFSAKRQNTKDKRIEEMINILNLGYKSKAGYLKDLK